MNISRLKKLKYSSMSVAFAVLVIGAVFLLNLAAGALTDRYSLKLDLTSSGMYKLTDRTKEALRNLEEPVTVYVMMSEGQFTTADLYSMINESLLRYVSESGGKVSIQYVDTVRNPTFTERYHGAASLTPGSLIVESGERNKQVPLEYILALQIDSSTNERYVTGLNVEQQVTSAITFVSAEKILTALSVTGHNEMLPYGFPETMTALNFELSNINLRFEDIPEDTDLLIISCPAMDYSKEELEKIVEFVGDCGDILVFFDVVTPRLPELELLFYEWGVEFEQAMVFDPDNSSPNAPHEIAVKLSDYPINDGLADRRGVSLIAPYARSLAIVQKPDGSILAHPVLTTGEKGYSKSYAYGNITTPNFEPGDREGVHNVALISEKAIIKDGALQYSRLLFIGSPYIADQGLIEVPSLLNADFIANSITYLTQQFSAYFVASKPFYAGYMLILSTESRIIFWCLIIIMPISILGCGFYIWRRRRNL